MTSSRVGSAASETRKVRSSLKSAMWSATPSSFLPIFTIVPVLPTFGANTAVQFGLAKIASATSLPTLRRSTSQAATTLMSLGL